MKEFEKNTRKAKKEFVPKSRKFDEGLVRRPKHMRELTGLIDEELELLQEERDFDNDDNDSGGGEPPSVSG